MKKIVMIGGFLAFGLILSNCGGSEQEQEEPANTLEAIEQMSKAAEEMQNKEPVDPVDFRKLKEILPPEVAGLERTEVAGEKSGGMGFSISQAAGKYSQDDSKMEIQIMDTGIGGMATMGLAAWSLVEVDKETSTGYEKTTKISGNKAYEKYDNNRKYGELNVLINNRMVVILKGRNVTMDQIKDALSDLDLDKLASLE